MPTSATGVVSASVPVLPAAYVVARPGTSPSITVPLRADRPSDLAPWWRDLAEAADWFAMPMPSYDEFVAAVDVARPPGVAGLVALTVTVVDHPHGAFFAVTSAPVPATAGDPVRIHVGAAVPERPRDGAPHWLSMALRTTSKGDADQLRRWLGARGYADGVTASGAPLLGALVVERDGALRGIDAAQATSVLDPLWRTGVIAEFPCTTVHPDVDDQVWWISPEYRPHPVAALGDVSFDLPSGGGLPTWWRA